MENKNVESQESRKTISDCSTLELFDYLKRIIAELEKRHFKYPFWAKNRKSFTLLNKKFNIQGNYIEIILVEEK